MEVGFYFRGRCFHQSGRHVSGFDDAFLEMLLVDGVDLVDKGQIPSVSGIEVMTKTPIDENVDDVGKTDK